MHSRLLPLLLVPTLSLAVAMPATQARAARAGLPTQVNSCWPNDNGDPVVDSVSLAPSTVDVSDGPATVAVTVDAHDTGGPGAPTGVAEVQADLDQVAPDGVGPAISLRLARGDDGLWHGSAVLPRGTHGTYRARAFASDGGLGAFNEQEPSAELTVTGTPDVTPPVLRDLHVSRTHVDTRRHAVGVHVTAKVTDAVSGVRDVRLGTSDQTVTWLPMHRLGDTNRWRTGFIVPRWNGRHAKDLRLTFADRVGNGVVVGSRELRRDGFPSRITIRSGPRDLTAPHVVRVQAAHRVDVRRHGRWYAVTLVAAGRRPVRHVRVSLWPGDHDLRDQARGLPLQASLHRVGGTARHGTWKGRMRVGRCQPGPARYTLATFVSDRFTTREHHHGMPVRVVSRDNLRPMFETADVEADRHVVTWSFSEPVHGVTSDDADVTTEDGQVISGSWDCRDGSADVTSCLTGSVRSAKFTPDDSSPTGPVPYAVTFSPEHHLEVLDRHGNPVLGTRTVQHED